MAKTKAKAKKTATKKSVKTNVKTFKATALLRKGTLAYIGMHGAAFDRMKMRLEQVRSTTDGLFEELVVKGEVMEAKATEFAKGTQVKAAEQYAETTSKVRGMLPKASNDRVTELEAEISKLNKKLVATTKKVAKPVKAKTDKVVKSAAEATQKTAEAVADKAEAVATKAA
ncbi:MAG: hypothetical protein ACPGVT_08290 [Maricaulaceae bacterium]